MDVIIKTPPTIFEKPMTTTTTPNLQVSESTNIETAPPVSLTPASEVVQTVKVLEDKVKELETKQTLLPTLLSGTQGQDKILDLVKELTDTKINAEATLRKESEALKQNAEKTIANMLILGVTFLGIEVFTNVLKVFNVLGN